MVGRKLKEVIKRWWNEVLFYFFWNKIKVLFYLEVLGFLSIIVLELVGVIWLINFLL